MKFGFERLVYHVPANSIEIEELASQAGYAEDMVARLHSGGLRKVPVDDDKPLYYLVRKALDLLLEHEYHDIEQIQGVVLAHSIPIIAPTDTPFLRLCLENTDLKEVAGFTISGQPCSILHFAVRAACNWLKEMSEDAKVIVIGADKAYSPNDRIYFGAAMGDVVVAGIISRKSPDNRILACVSQTEVIAYNGEDSHEDDILLFRKLNPFYIRSAIETCLRKGGITLGELKWIMPHTPYTMIWDTIGELIQFPRERIFTGYISETGHFNSNDSFAHYIRASIEGLIRPGDTALLVNPGFGGTRGCTLLIR